MRRYFLLIHRWLGITISPVLVLVGLTGAYLVWFRSKILTGIHTRLLAGEVGEWLVNGATIISAVLVISGIVLWWRRKIVTIGRGKGWWRFLFDLHHLVGIVGAAVMLVIALSGTALMVTEGIDRRRSLPKDDPNYPTQSEIRLRRVLHGTHTAGPFKRTFGVVWVVFSAAFAVEALSGVLMWWKPAAAKD